MKIQKVIRKGWDENHPVHCEDFLTMQNGARYFIGAVFDGCSGGNESHFASTLFGKIFNQCLNSNAFSGLNSEEKIRNLMKAFVDKLFQTKALLSLHQNDLLATFIMIVYDKVEEKAFVVNVGDGVICCDGNLTIFENDRFIETDAEKDKYKSMPDYIAYDIDDLGLDVNYFDTWYERRVNMTIFDKPNDISIATDGVLTFTRPTEVDGKEIDPVNFLLVDNNWVKNKIMLVKKVNKLRTGHKTVHKDDISIIRIFPNFEDSEK